MQVKKKKNSARWIAKYRQTKHNTKFLSLCLPNILNFKTSALIRDEENKNKKQKLIQLLKDQSGRFEKQPLN